MIHCDPTLKTPDCNPTLYLEKAAACAMLGEIGPDLPARHGAEFLAASDVSSDGPRAASTPTGPTPFWVDL